MRKANKIPFIILLTVAIALIAATLALLFIPEPHDLKVTEKPAIETAYGGYVLKGKIKNVSEKEIILGTYDLRVEVSAINESNKKITYELRPADYISIQPNEEFDLSAIQINLGEVKNLKVTKISVTPDKTGYIIYGGVINDGKFALLALLTGIAGAGLLLIAICTYVTEVRNTKRTNNIIIQMRQTFENGVYAEGYYGNKAKNRTAAAKTTASVFGAIISMIFIGFGRYKIYSQSAKNEFIITETAIYMYLNGKFQNVTNELKTAFVNPSVSDKKNKINVRGENKNVFLTVRTDSADTAQTLNNLKNIFENSAQPENTQEDNYGETD